MKPAIKTYCYGKEILVPKELEGRKATELTIVLSEEAGKQDNIFKGLP